MAALEGGKAIAITLPDVEELRRTVEYMGDAEPWPNVRLNSLGGDTAPDRNPLEGLWSNVFKQSGGGDAVVAEWAGMYVLLGASCQELPTIKDFLGDPAVHEHAAPGQHVRVHGLVGRPPGQGEAQAAARVHPCQKRVQLCDGDAHVLGHGR